MSDYGYDTLQKRMTSRTGNDNVRTVSLKGRRKVYETSGSEIMRLGSMHLLGRLLKAEWMVQ
jgi:hypothetical protein